MTMTLCSGLSSGGSGMMAVYVDDLRAIGYYEAGCFGRRARFTCHLMADSDDELEAFRKRLQLRPGWKHRDHYDLTPNKRRQAIHGGAIEVSSAYLVELRQKRAAVTSGARE